MDIVSSRISGKYFDRKILNQVGHSYGMFGRLALFNGQNLINLTCITAPCKSKRAVVFYNLNDN